MAGSEEEEEEQEQTTLKLPLLPLKQDHDHHNTHSPERSEELHSSVSIPFSWEEHPGKPKHSTTHSSSSPSSPKHLKTLELPPRLLLEREITKLSSPTMVLDGPYSMGRSRRFDSSSFRMMLRGSENCYGSFRSDVYSPGFDEVEEGNQKVNALVSRGREGGQNGKFGFVRLWRKRALKRRKVEFGGGSYVFPSNGELENGDSHGKSKVKISENKSHFWASVYGGLKQVVPWKRTRS